MLNLCGTELCTGILFSIPKLLDYSFSMKKHPKVFFAGQITGVEGYAESAASGLMAALQCASTVLGKGTFLFPSETALHALSAYVSCEDITDFQPMNVNFGIIKPLGMRVKGKREKNEAISARSVEALKDFDII